MTMSEMDCYHELSISSRYSPGVMDSVYADVTVEGTCEKCGAEWTSQYTWDVTEGEQIEDGTQLYECDECGKEDMEDFAVEGEHGGGWATHFCSQACHDEYYKGDEEE